MVSQKDIRRKIKAVDNIKKVTKAMETIASIRLQKAVKTVNNARAYSKDFFEFSGSIIASTDSSVLGEIAITKKREVKTVLYIALASDRGLCGVFNSKLLNSVVASAGDLVKSGKSVKVLSVGKKAADVMSRKGYSVISKYPGLTSENAVKTANSIVKEIVALFEKGEVDEVVLAYNLFASTARQEVTENKIIPVSSGEKESVKTEYILEPKGKELIESIIVHGLMTTLSQAMFDSIASEHAARMIAMQQSTTNADEMITDLTMLYNKVRQALITREIIEVVSGVEAQK